MKSLSKFFAIASGIFAVLPGVTVLISNIGVPPNSSNALFSATVEALGVLMLIILWLNKNSIQLTSEKRITSLAIGGVMLFVISLFGYLFLFGYLIIDVPNSKSVFFPLWAEGDLKMNLEKFANKSEMITQFGRDDVAKLIQNSSKSSLLITTLILLFIYQLIFVALTFSFGLLAVKCSSDEDIKKNTPKQSKESDSYG